MAVKFYLIFLIIFILKFHLVYNSKISNSVTNSKNKFSQVSIQWNNVHVCSGSILNTRYVLTAAHCVAKFTSGVPYSKQTIAIRISEENQISIAKIIIHPNFKYYTNDLAIIKLAQPLTLPSSTYEHMELFRGGKLPEGSEVTVHDWKQTLIGNEMNDKTELDFDIFTLLSEENCRREMKDIFVIVLCLIPRIPDKFSFPQSGRSAVYKGKLIGLGSFLNIENENIVGFVNISHYVSWIKNIIDL